MATTNTYSDIYIADSDGTDKVYLDLDTATPFFIPPRTRSQVSKTCLPGLSSGTLSGGKTIHFDGGTDVTGTIIEFTCRKMTSTTYTSLLTKWNLLDTVLFSADNGTNIYSCVWDANGFQVSRPPGRTTYELTIRLRVVSKTV